MLLARVLGSATATVRSPAMAGWRLAVVQPLTKNGAADGYPLVAIDPLGARAGDDVMITSDGKWVGEVMNSQQTPVRWAVLGVPD